MENQETATCNCNNCKEDFNIQGNTEERRKGLNEYRFLKCPFCNIIFPYYITNNNVNKRQKEINSLLKQLEKAKKTPIVNRFKVEELYKKYLSMYEENKKEQLELMEQHKDEFSAFGEVFRG